MVGVGETLLVVFFGSEFREFGTLVWALGTWQIVAVPILGFSMFLKAQQRGSGLVVGSALDAAITLVLVVLLARNYDLQGAAWGYAGGSFAATVVAGYLAMRPSHRPGLNKTDD
jgi:O-antigen/teichoic acid export membrane protein